MSKIKLKDGVDLDELYHKYNLNIDEVEVDYNEHILLILEYYRDGVFINANSKEIYGIDVSDLSLLYHLIKDDLIEEVK